MTSKRALIMALTLSVSLVTASTQAQAQSPTSCPSSLSARAISIERPTRLLILPAEAPPSQVVLSFSRLEDGEQRTLTWAPTQTQGLAREQLLEPGCWQLGWSAAAMRPPQNPLIDLAWQPEVAFMPPASCGLGADGALAERLLGCAQMSVQRGRLGQALSVAKVPILLTRQRSP